MSDTFERARDLMSKAKTHPDPEGAMRAIERQALPKEPHIFFLF